MTKKYFPPGWDEERVRQVLIHYETQTEEDAIVEDERAFKETSRTTIKVPIELMPVTRDVIAQYETKVGIKTTRTATVS